MHLDFGMTVVNRSGGDCHVCQQAVPQRTASTATSYFWRNSSDARTTSFLRLTDLLAHGISIKLRCWFQAHDSPAHLTKHECDLRLRGQLQLRLCAVLGLLREAPL